MIPLSLIS